MVRRVERIQLQGLDTGSSRALVGGTLCYTDTSNWCSSLSSQDTSLTAYTEAEEEQFTLSESVGKLVFQQLEHGNVVRVCTSQSRRNAESSVIDGEREERSVGDEATAELVPLSFLDELERKGAKILTPRPLSAYTPPPIVSETYPVLSSRDEYEHKPFSSPGFHTLGPSQRPTGRRTIHSAVVRITESLQAAALEKRRRGKEEEERLNIGALRNKVLQTRTVSLKVLSADGNVAKDTELRRFSVCCKKLSTFPTTPPPTGRSPRELPEAPGIPLMGPSTASPTQRRGSTKVVGPVLNGMNPNQAETSVSPQESFRPLLTLTKRLPHSTFHNMGREPSNWKSNKRNFMFISKPLPNNTMNIRQFVYSKQQPSREPQSQSVDFGAEEDGSRRATNTPFDPERAITIPTAENML
ncbi:uncharacterized protein [Centroberyx affinis]|uniref:uncharacterized protein n=1 Tax=Centroberyx affinis TaxID=166261 RepID=UPI003A5BFC87